MDNEDLIRAYFKKGVKYINGPQMIFTSDDDHVLDIRGWGRIQYMFNDKRDALKFQDDIGKWVADAINQKLNRENGIES